MTYIVLGAERGTALKGEADISRGAHRVGDVYRVASDIDLYNDLYNYI